MQARRACKSRASWAPGLDGRPIEFDAGRDRAAARRAEHRSRRRPGLGLVRAGRIDPARGGSPRAEVDALRLLAVVLAHWDNKSANQRLICLPGGDRPDGGCTTPLAMMQDLGATFGPAKVDLHNWRRMRRCGRTAQRARVSMEDAAVRRRHVPRPPDLGRRTPDAARAARAALDRGRCASCSRRSRHRSSFDGSQRARGRDADAWVQGVRGQDPADSREAGRRCPLIMHRSCAVSPH